MTPLEHFRATGHHRVILPEPAAVLDLFRHATGREPRAEDVMIATYTCGHCGRFLLDASPEPA